MLFMFKILMSCLPYQWYVYIHMPSTIIQQRAPSATRAVAASRGTRECQGISKASTFRLKFFGNCYSTYVVCTTTLLLDFDYQLPCTFERPAAIAAIAGDRQLAAPRALLEIFLP